MIIAGTGHRPSYCPCKYKDVHPWLNKLKEDVGQAFVDNGVTTVISGMAIGWDTWIAQVALDMGIPVHAYVPFKGQGSKWPTSSRREYERIIEASAEVLYISESYSNEAFLKRDRAMVDAADEVYALLNPLTTSGGTFYTVKYTEGVGKPIKHFWRD